MPHLKVELKDIIFDPKVQTYCVSPSFKCPSYGHSWACPPEAPYMEAKISEFKEFYLIYYQLDITEFVNNQKLKYPNKNENTLLHFSRGMHRIYLLFLKN